MNQQTGWMQNTCSRKKNGALQICIDPKLLNKYIKRTHHKTQTLEEISHKLAGAKHFTKLDAKHGYWAIHPDEESSLLTCFNTPFGRCRYLRCPFGLKMSQDIYQQKMDQILEDCDRAIRISYDVCIYGKTIEEHDRRLRKTMDTAQKYRLVFNKEKCKIRQKPINFYGLIWDENGSHPDPEKCDKIKSKRTTTVLRYDPIPKPFHTKTQFQNSPTEVITQDGHWIPMERNLKYSFPKFERPYPWKYMSSLLQAKCKNNDSGRCKHVRTRCNLNQR